MSPTVLHPHQAKLASWHFRSFPDCPNQGVAFDIAPPHLDNRCLETFSSSELGSPLL